MKSRFAIPTLLASAWMLGFVILPPAAAQQDRGAFTGFVSDPSGLPVAGARLVVRNVSSNATWETTSNERGQFLVPNLPVGPYEVTCEMAGFRSIVRAGLQLNVAQVTRLDFLLEVGQVTESVRVTAEAPLLQTETPEVGTLLDNRSVADLPLSFSGGRSPESFAYRLAPGVSGDPWTSRINGSPAFSKEVLLEGASVTGYVGGDLWTSDGDLVYLVRLGDEGTPWSVTHERVMTYKRLTPGLYRFEVMARDADLNYSTPQALLIEVAKPSALIHVPILGSMAPTTLGFLFVVVLTAIVGSGFGLVAVYNARRRPRQAVTRRFNPYISGEPIRRADMFFGREEVLRKILQTLHSNSIMIYGERRIGKTTLLHQIGEHLNQQDDPSLHYIPVYIDLEGTPQSIFFRTLMEEIVAGTRGHLAERPPLALDETTAEEYGDREFITDLRALLGALSQALAPQAVRVILLIDEMDAINSYDSLVQQQLRRVFMQAFSANLGAVVAGVHISKEWDRLESPWYNLFIETKLEPFTPDEARRLIEEPVRGVYTWDEEAVAFVIEKSEGRPYQIQQLCLEAVNLMIEARRERVLLEDVQRAYAITEHDRLA